MSRYLTVVEKLGFFFALVITELCKFKFLNIYLSIYFILWEIFKYLYDVPRALHVHPWLVHRQELHALQVAEAPEQNLQFKHFTSQTKKIIFQMKQTHLESVLCERWPDPNRDGENPSAVGRPSSSCGGALLRLWEGGKLLLAVSVG